MQVVAKQRQRGRQGRGIQAQKVISNLLIRPEAVHGHKRRQGKNQLGLMVRIGVILSGQVALTGEPVFCLALIGMYLQRQCALR